ncbi:MAG: deoxyribose-phosphate aldolase [Lutispora sp.]|jgi:deoxyribose-phosphate aldolase|uniref:deoxyribose-phosphate aldolase n=1 Tax=Lutispora sp. TaxID=2828727 RepID=UPI003562EB2F
MKDLAPYIDHTILKPEASEEDIARICNEALEYGFASVCINPCYVKLASSILKNSSVKVCTVIGFPLGANTSIVKAFEAEEAIQNGAHEIDMVLNIGALKNGDLQYVTEDIAAVARVCKGKALLKVIIETCLLEDDEKVEACKAAKLAGADYVKTSTGFSKAGAREEDVALMRKVVGDDMGVKASGGIRDLDTALAMIRAGATRIGASASINIMKELDK